MPDLIKIVSFLALAATSAFASESEYGFNYRCAEIEGRAFMQAVVESGNARAHCLAGAGFLKEARGALRDNPGYTHPRLANALTAMFDGDPDSYASLLSDANAGSAEAAFWLLAAPNGEFARALNASSRSGAVDYFLTAPNWTKMRFALPVAEKLIAANDFRNALALAENLGATTDENGAQDRASLSRFINARILESRGAWSEASREYATVNASVDAQLNAEASLRRIALLWRTGAVKTGQAVDMLETLDLDWRGGAVGAKIRLALSRTYEFNERHYDAVSTLGALIHSSAPAAYRAEARARLRNVAATYFVDHAAEAHAVKLIDIHQRYRSIIAPADRYWIGDAPAARILVNAGLTGYAAEILGAQTTAEIVSAGGADVAIDYAGILATAGAYERAQAFLNAAGETSDRPPETVAAIDLIKAAVTPEEELNVWDKEPPAPEARGLLAARSWTAGAWDVFLTVSTPLENAQDSALTHQDRKAIAAYLARSERPLLNNRYETASTVSRALALRETDAPYYAKDLRALLEPSDAILALSGLLAAPPDAQSENTVSGSLADPAASPVLN